MAFALDKKEIENIETRYSKFVPDIEAFLNRIGSQEYYDAQLRGIKPESKDDFTTSTTSNSTEDEYEDEEYIEIEEDTTADRLKAKLQG